MALEDTRVSLENIQKRLQILEMSDSVKTIAAIQAIQDNHIDVEDEGHKYIYLFPIHCDKTGGIIYRTPLSEHGNCGFQSRSLQDRGTKDTNDLEIKLLKSELQRKELEIERQDSELRKLRHLESEEERNAVSDKFVDKINTIKSAASVPQQTSHYDDSSVTLSGNIVNSSNGLEGAEGLQDSAHITQRRNLMVPVEHFDEEIVSVKQDNEEELSLVPDFERTMLSSECSYNALKLHETICACLSSMQLSLGHLHSNIKLHDIQGNDTSNIDNGAVEDQLFILEKTIMKLKDLCQELVVNQISIPNDMNHQIAIEKPECQIIDRMIEKLIQDGSRIRALENSCLEKDKKIEDLENQIQAILESTEAALMEKYELTSVVMEMNTVAEKRRKQMEDNLSLTGELLERLHVNEEKAESLSRRAQDAEEESIVLLKRVEDLQKMLKAEKQDNESLRSKNEILKLKISLAEFQLNQQDSALERLTSHLHSQKEWRSLDEVEVEDARHQLKSMKKNKDEVEEKVRLMEAEALRSARHMPIRLKISDIDNHVSKTEDCASFQSRSRMSQNQVNQAQGFLDELEEKLHSMQTEVSKAFKGMPKIT